MWKKSVLIAGCLISFALTQAVFAQDKMSSSILRLLPSRELAWPNWQLSGPILNTENSKELIYPKWFEGRWNVYSFDTEKSEAITLQHQARFELDYLGRVVANRAFNAKSLGKKIFGNELLNVVNDPINPNSQISILNRNRFIETKVISMIQDLAPNNIFWSDEIVIQVLHSKGIPIIDRVETLSRFQLCNDLKTFYGEPFKGSICADQWQATYPSPGEAIRPSALHTSHYKLILIPDKK